MAGGCCWAIVTSAARPLRLRFATAGGGPSRATSRRRRGVAWSAWRRWFRPRTNTATRREYDDRSSRNRTATARGPHRPLGAVLVVVAFERRRGGERGARANAGRNQAVLPA